MTEPLAHSRSGVLEITRRCASSSSPSRPSTQHVNATLPGPSHLPNRPNPHPRLSPHSPRSPRHSSPLRRIASHDHAHGHPFVSSPKTCRRGLTLDPTSPGHPVSPAHTVIFRLVPVFSFNVYSLGHCAPFLASPSTLRVYYTQTSGFMFAPRASAASLVPQVSSPVSHLLYPSPTCLPFPSVPLAPRCVRAFTDSRTVSRRVQLSGMY
jgi:hypothetical protein